MGGSAPSWVAREVDWSLLVISSIGAGLWLGIIGLMIFFVVKYRRSQRDRTRGVQGHLGLEIAWTVVPVLIVLGMFFVGYRGFLNVRKVPRHVLEVRVNAQRWYWSFEYPEQHVVWPELYLPRGQPVKLIITSALDDVLHSFYVPAFRVKEDAVPGTETYAWLDPDRLGTYNIFCAEFCGDQHSQMLSRLHVVEPAAFRAWLEERQREKYAAVPAEEAVDADTEELRGQDGRKLFVQYCQACHGPDGRGGPPWGARNLTSLQGFKRGIKRSDLLLTISEGLPGTLMRPFRYLSALDRVALLDYVASLAPGPRPPPTAADVALVKRRLPEFDPSQPGKSYTTPLLPLDEAMRRVVKERAQ